MSTIPTTPWLLTTSARRNVNAGEAQLSVQLSPVWNAVRAHAAPFELNVPSRSHMAPCALPHQPAGPPQSFGGEETSGPRAAEPVRAPQLFMSAAATAAVLEPQLRNYKYLSEDRKSLVDETISKTNNPTRSSRGLIIARAKQANPFRRWSRMTRRVVALFIALAVSGCATAHLTAFRDPAYANKQFGKVTVFAVGMRLDATEQVERAICDKVTPTPCAIGLNILPPTRKYTADDLAKVLEEWGIDGVLVVTLASDQSNAAYAGTVTQSSASATANTNGSANLYGNFGVWNSATSATASGQSVSTPVYVDSRQATAYIALYERSSGAMAWGGELRVSGQGGGPATSDREFIRVATNKVAEQLRAAGLLK